MDPKIQKWIRWLKVIEDEIMQLLIAKDIFWAVQKLIRGNKKIQKPSSFYQYLGYTYISYIVMGIRRQTKIDQQSISLARLLKDIADNYKKITREYYKELYKNLPISHLVPPGDLGDQDFDEFCSQPGDQNISMEMPINDLCILRTQCQILEDYADKRIAHSDKRGIKNIPKFHHVDESIDMFKKLYIKYHKVLNGPFILDMEPIFQYDWQAIFDFPWRVKKN